MKGLFKGKDKKIDYFSENLAVPEIHVGSEKKAPEDDDISKEDDGDLIFENLAVPEINMKNFRKKKQ